MTLLRLLPVALIGLPLALAQSNTNVGRAPAPDEKTLPLSVESRDAPLSYSNLRIHVSLRVGSDRKGEQPAPSSSTESGNSFSRIPGEASPNGLGARLPEPAASVAGVPAPGFYPADLSYLGGAVLKSVESHNIYLNQPAAHWGNPGKFLLDLGNSKFIHVVDQYVDETASNRYTVGGGGTIPYPTFSTLGQNDLLQIVHSAASLFGTGYGHIYHVFLPKGVDYCDPTGSCYSPDNLSTFAFCAFHSSVDFTDIGHVLFSLQAYANVNGCSIEQPSPNGALKDSVDNLLSHELIEAITDPDGDAWFALSSFGTAGQEIGDLCVGFDPSVGGYKDPVSKINGLPYEIQFEYSNTYHACANVR